MAIDDNPIKAVKRQFEMEDLATSPVTGRVLEVVSKLALVAPLDKAVEFLKRHAVVEQVFSRGRRFLDAAGR